MLLSSWKNNPENIFWKSRIFKVIHLGFIATRNWRKLSLRKFVLIIWKISLELIGWTILKIIEVNIFQNSQKPFSIKEIYYQIHSWLTFVHMSIPQSDRFFYWSSWNFIIEYWILNEYLWRGMQLYLKKRMS